MPEQSSTTTLDKFQPVITCADSPVRPVAAPSHCVPADVADALKVAVSFDELGADTAACQALFAATKRVRSFLDSLEITATRASTRLASVGQARDVAAVHINAGGMSRGESLRRQRRLEAVQTAPSFEAALEAGKISADHIDVLDTVTRKLDEETRERLLDGESDLLDSALRMSPDLFKKFASLTARRLGRNSPEDLDAAARRNTFITHSINQQSGMYEGRFAFHPELGHKLFRRIDRQLAQMFAETDNRASKDCPANRQRLAAEALGFLIESTGSAPQPRQAKADIVIVVGREGLVTSDSAPLPSSTVERLTCHANFIVVNLDCHGLPLDVGRLNRSATSAQRHALRAIYSHCAIPDCDVAFDRCEIHHIHEWERGGRTDLANLVPICRRHHHLLHAQNWKLRLDAKRMLSVVLPAGDSISSPPDLRQFSAIAPGPKTLAQAPGSSPGEPPETVHPPTREKPESGQSRRAPIDKRRAQNETGEKSRAPTLRRIHADRSHSAEFDFLKTPHTAIIGANE